MTDKFPLVPGAVIGIIGGGQLGRMLAMSAAQLGFRAHVYCPEAGSPAAEVSYKHTCAEYSDLVAIQKFAKSVDVLTYEFENIPSEPLQILSESSSIFPPVKALRITQDRLDEKQFLRDLSIPVAPFAAVNSFDDLKAAIQTIGLPAMLKTCRFGYDGKGQHKFTDDVDLERIYKEKFDGVPAVLEGFIDFESELSIVMARGLNGEVAAYDVSRNNHIHQILSSSVVPSGIDESVCNKAYDIAARFANSLNYTGVFAVEFFYCGDKASESLIVNEIAPRVHNTGHWTMDACAVSQFENHIRAIVGWPLGETSRHSSAKMVNLIGDEVYDYKDYAKQDNAALHLYGKSEVRDGRKMGHVTILGGS